jgi:hypothetical protein
MTTVPTRPDIAVRFPDLSDPCVDGLLSSGLGRGNAKRIWGTEVVASSRRVRSLPGRGRSAKQIFFPHPTMQSAAP